jgi:hypothetical protein
MKTLLQRKKQLLVAGLLVISFFLLMDLNTRLTVLFRTNNTHNEMKTSIYELESTKQLLLTQIAFANSDEGVKRFANEEKHWFQDKEIPILPVQDPKATPPPTTKPMPTPMVVEHWQRWWALFFGE